MEESKNHILQNMISLKKPVPVEAGMKESAPSAKESDVPKASQTSESGVNPSSKPLSVLYPPAAVVPTQEGALGIRFDFNLGIRVQLPKLPDGEVWILRMYDRDTDTLIFATEGQEAYVMSRKKHFINARLEVERNGKLVWSHDYEARGKKVAVQFPGSTLGDSLGWFPYVVRFAEVHGCELTVVISQQVRTLLAPRYPHIRFLVPEEFEAVREAFYATYYLGLFFADETNEWQPADFRMVGLHRTAGYILGVDPTETPPLLSIEKAEERPIDAPYVVVAVQASSACKLWNNPGGWLDIVAFLKEKGYRVVCIDQRPVTGFTITWNALPFGVEDETGDRPLGERARWLKHADFFVGLSSGLSWLAWAAGTPVVMISGFTHPNNEFHTPWRVFSTHGCNSCWHDVRVPFQHDDYHFCPRHKGTPRQFECTRLISAGYVQNTISKLVKDLNLQWPRERSGG